MKYKKLSEYAKDNGICYHTAYSYFRKGLIPNTKQLETGTILVGYGGELNKIDNRAVIYARVSSTDAKSSLKEQQKRLESYAISKGYTIIKLISEISSGMNDNRPKLSKLLLSDDYDVIVVEHKDRLTRFGFNYIRNLLEKDNKKIDVVNLAKNDNENLMEDLISIIYSFSARMYSKRRYMKKAKNIIKELEKE